MEKVESRLGTGFTQRLRVLPCPAFVVVLASLISATSAFAAPFVIDGFEYPDNATAQAAWGAIDGSPPVEMADYGEWGSERVMRLPCNFSVQQYRCSWDRSAVLDLSEYGGFALDVFVPDSGAVADFTLYFHAESGWYARWASIAEQGWQTLYFMLADFAEEGSPAGWDQIDTIRLSPWKEADRDTYLAVGELRAFTPLVYIIRDTQAVDSWIVDSTIERLTEWLRRQSVSFGVIPDGLAESGYLSGSRMAILPYNEVISSALQTQLNSYVASGGKLMVYYLLQDGIEDLLGIERTGYSPGDFAAYSFSDSIIQNLPDRVAQDSWNITIAAPRAELSARIIATWEDSDGTPTGHPAWLASDNGLFMSHILLSDDALVKQYMLLALIGHYVPEIWPDAAFAAIDNIGKIGEYVGYDQAVSDIRATGASTPRAAQVEDALSLADAARTHAIAALDIGEYGQVALVATEARQHLLEAYFLCQSPVEPEFRAVWEHSGTGPFPGDWPAAIDILADNGFDAVFPNMLWGGLAHYDSALLPHSQEFDTYGDQITACVDAAHAREIEVHVWKVNWYLAGASQTFIDDMRAAARTQVSAGGDPTDWLCPSHPDNFALERDSMLEVVANYDVDGIHFDYIRYPNADHCYCDGCRTRFETESGYTVGIWPADVRPGGPLESVFLDWRRAQTTELVDAVYAGAKALKPHVKVSAAVFSSYAYAFDGVGQDWVGWIDDGIVDFLCPMDYTDDFQQFRDLVAEQMGHAAGRIPIYPGIGASTLQGSPRPGSVIVEILATREADTGGFILFDYGSDLANEQLPALGKGTTAVNQPAIPAVSQWGMIVLALLLLTAHEGVARVRSCQRRWRLRAGESNSTYGEELANRSIPSTRMPTRGLRPRRTCL